MVMNVKMLLETPEPKWLHERPTLDDVQEFKKQTEKSPFDPFNLRSEQWKLLEEKKAELQCLSCPYGKVLWICPFGSKVKPRLRIWGRILQWYGNQSRRIFWFPSSSLRRMPQIGEQLNPGHINGGYTIPCDARQIVIYRKEDAERVLFHELSHASCLDNMKESVEMREARTEFWAEMWMVALFSKGSMARAKQLWKHQAQWIVNQNAILRMVYKVTRPQDYVWRYTLGREVIANQVRIPLPCPSLTRSRSLRLAAPIFDTLSI
jgi:hypothetical protein